MKLDTADLMACLCADKSLSKARLAKMVYLADWYACLETGEQLTDLEWYYDHYGPYLSKIFDIAKSDARFETFRAGRADIIRLKDNSGVIKLDQTQTSIVDRVRGASSAKQFREFLKLIYGTYPIRTVDQYSRLNLPVLAKEFNSLPR